MKIRSKNQDIGLITEHRQNVTLPRTGNTADDFQVEAGAKAFVITVFEDCQIRCRTTGGEIDTFKFNKGEDPGAYDKILSHTDNSEVTISIRY